MDWKPRAQECDLTHLPQRPSAWMVVSTVSTTVSERLSERLRVLPETADCFSLREAQVTQSLFSSKITDTASQLPIKANCKLINLNRERRPAQNRNLSKHRAETRSAGVLSHMRVGYIRYNVCLIDPLKFLPVLPRLPGMLSHGKSAK